SLTGLRIPNAWRLLAENNAEAAADSVESALARWETGTFHAQHLWGIWVWPQVDLYAGHPQRAWDRLQRARKPMARSLLLLRVQAARALIYQLRGGVALALARAGVEPPRPLLREARRRARALAREQNPYTIGHAYALRAGIARLNGREDAARASLVAACDA